MLACLPWPAASEDAARQRHLVLRNSLISDTSTEGFYVIGSSDVPLERNIFRRNNVEQLTGYYPAGW